MPVSISNSNSEVCKTADTQVKGNSTRPFRICLVDLRLTGHHSFYLANFADCFDQLGCKVDLFTPDSDLCRGLIREALPDLELDRFGFFDSNTVIPKRRKYGCYSYFNLLALQREIRSRELLAGIDYSLVYFTYLDDVSYPDFALPYLLKKPFNNRFSGLLMGPREKLLDKKIPFPISIMFTTFLQQKSAKYQDIGLLVEDVQASVEKKIGKATFVYPDFCTPAPLNACGNKIVEKIKQKSGGRMVTSLLGSIQPHKSLDLFFECVKAASNSKYFFVVAGKINKQAFKDSDWEIIRPVLEDPPENLLVFDQWLESEAVFDAIVQESEYLFAYYRKFRKSSNLLTKSAFYSKPVIVCSDHLMGERVTSHKLGFAVKGSEITSLYTDGDLDSFSYDESLRSSFVENNSVSRLKDVLSQLVERERYDENNGRGAN